MKFNHSNPVNEDNILILCANDEYNYIVQGHFYIDEDDYYGHDGEFLNNAIAWAKMPEIEFIAFTSV